MDITPVFIFSLPRSGSTLLQRLLAAHENIDTCAEPWVLLPAAYGSRRGLYAEYGHSTARKGLRDFLAQIEDGDQAYANALGAYGKTLYGRAAGEGATHFVDKTPRYHLIVDQIIDAFPEGKFIFLWRNPIAVAASISNTWTNGYWYLGHYRIDLYKGLKNLVFAAQQRKDHEIHELKFEDLLRNKKSELKKIYKYLGIRSSSKEKVKLTEKNIQGRLGDPTGTEEYSEVSKEPIEKWKKSIINIVRKRWCLRYIEWIGEDMISYMGYEAKNMKNDLEKINAKNKNIFADLFYLVREKIRPWVHPSMQKQYFRQYKDGETIYEVY